MNAPTVMTGSEKVMMKNGNFFINKYHDKTAEINNWVIVWERDSSFLSLVMNGIRDSAKKMGIKVSKPDLIELPDCKRQPSHLRDASILATKKNP